MSISNIDTSHIRIPLPRLPPFPFDPTDRCKELDKIYGSSPSLLPQETSNTDDRNIATENRQSSTNVLFQIAKHSTSEDTLDDKDLAVQPRGWFRRWFVGWCMTKIVSWCFGVVCMVIIAVVLSKYDENQIQHGRSGYP